MPQWLQRAKKTVFYMMHGNGSDHRLQYKLEYVINAVICLSVVLIVLESMSLDVKYTAILQVCRWSFFSFFLTEYLLRIWIADLVTGSTQRIIPRLRYIFSATGIIDLLALMPVMLGGTFIDFRIFRVVRLLRITQLKAIKRYTDVLMLVFRLKKAQLLASIFIVMVFMLVSAVIIYDLEYPVQPDVFQSVLSGLWWSMSAVTTVGYGDMYPITPLGKVFASFISVFGVFLMAVPIGILTTGFFEVSQKRKINDALASDAEEDNKTL